MSLTPISEFPACACTPANAAGTRFLGDHPALRGLVYGTVCGAMFGIFFVCLRNAGISGVFWPVCTSRLATRL
jgi:hypothetical protein